MANDEQSYKQWTRALNRVITSFEELEANPTVESTMRYVKSTVIVCRCVCGCSNCGDVFVCSANADVELAVNAASKSSI